MSTETSTPRTPQNTSPTRAPDSLAKLPASCRTVHAELLTRTESSTAADIARSTELGRSTVTKALVLLEEHGYAHRTPGGHDGARRTPDLWHTTPEEAENPDTTPSTTNEEEANTNSPSGTAGTETHSDTATATPTMETPAPETTTTDDGGTAPEPSLTTTEELPERDAEAAEDTVPDAEATEVPRVEIPSPRTESSPTLSLVPAQRTTPPPTIPLTGNRNRLAPGGLRQLVADYLTAYPGEAFTATRISREIDRSSGAIANALVTLTNQGVAEQVCDRPRTYRAATPKDAA